jgi:hypothetical protein
MDAKDRLKNLRAGLDGTIFSAQNHVHSDAERDALVSPRSSVAKSAAILPRVAGV